MVDNLNDVEKMEEQENIEQPHSEPEKTETVEESKKEETENMAESNEQQNNAENVNEQKKTEVTEKSEDEPQVIDEEPDILEDEKKSDVVTQNEDMSNTNMQMANVIRELTEGVQAQMNIAYGLDRKKTEALVDDKVNKQIAAIKAGIVGINPKFGPKIRGYEIIKNQILSTSGTYEATLRDFANLFDNKLSKLYIELAGLYGHLIGEMANSQYLQEQLIKRKESAENSGTKVKFLDRIKNAIASIGKAKNEKDAFKILRSQDEKEIAEELNQTHEQSLKTDVDNANSKKTESTSNVDTILQNIHSTKKHIEMIRDKKQKAIQNAMETEEKSLSKNIRRPRAITRFTRFLASRINLSKVVENTVLVPVSLRISEFRQNELVDTALALSDTEGEATIREDEKESFARQVVNSVKTNLAPYLNSVEYIKDAAKQEEKQASERAMEEKIMAELKGETAEETETTR